MNEKEPMRKHTLNLFDGDFDRLQRMYPDIGAAAIIRRLIRKHLESVEPKMDISKIAEALNV